MFEPGTLWERVTQVSAEAARSGAIETIPTDCEIVEQRGVRFIVRIVSGPARKPTAASPGGNPFLPCSKDLFVADVSDTHVCVLNKFNVLDHHLLIVTREFEEQESLLTERDFEALWTCMAEIDGLGFYNAGEIAGASQRHKHLQLVPLPLADAAERIPLERLIEAASFDGLLGTASGLPFRHVVARVESGPGDPPRTARETLPLYRSMLRAVRAERLPYNLLVTRGWMLLVPRRHEAFEGISVNSLGFAGALLVRDAPQLQRIKSRGPMSVLESVALRP